MDLDLHASEDSEDSDDSEDSEVMNHESCCAPDRSFSWASAWASWSGVVWENYVFLVIAEVSKYFKMTQHVSQN